VKNYFSVVELCILRREKKYLGFKKLLISSRLLGDVNIFNFLELMCIYRVNHL